MAKTISGGSASSLAPDTVRLVEAPECPAIAIYNLGGEFFATENLCSHGDASLAEGEVMDGKIYCPLHGGAFEIKTGEAVEVPCLIDLRTFPVSAEGDELKVQID